MRLKKPIFGGYTRIIFGGVGLLFALLLLVSCMVGVYTIVKNRDTIVATIERKINSPPPYTGSYGSRYKDIAPTITPTPIPPFPVIRNVNNLNWVPYEANCLGLREHITVYIPDTWEVGQDGETTASDMVNENEECMIQLGYPYSPLGRQNSYVPGLHGYITIASWLAPEKTLNSMLKEYTDGGMVAHVVNLANGKWIEEGTNLERKSSHFFNMITLRTLYRGREYNVRYGVVDWENLDFEQKKLLYIVGEMFVDRLQLH